jgi:hypothetical protein
VETIRAAIFSVERKCPTRATSKYIDFWIIFHYMKFDDFCHFIFFVPQRNYPRGGAAAIALMVTESYLYVANAGDCRAVLCRGGQSMPLSSDHKPMNPSELRRIVAAGGKVEMIHGHARCVD